MLPVMSKTATITHLVPVRHSIRPDVNREFITFDIENGWDDVKKIHKKILSFDGRNFQFSGWNSDSNECYFFRPLNSNCQVAKFI
jgi:hypothetical protein